MPETIHPIIIIGAGPAGLAVAGRLKHSGIDSLILEQAGQVGSSWVNHYDRLHLHTIKEYSHLPHFKLPEDWPQYISKNQLIDHLTDYCIHFDLSVKFFQKVIKVKATRTHWEVTTDQNKVYTANQVVVCSGYNRVPFVPTWPGQRDFKGTLVHSRSYQNARPYADCKVLVVGMGNTGAEIALDLVENGAQPSVSIRGPVNIVPRDFKGRPTQKTAMILRKLPNWLGDRVGVLLRRIAVGDLSEWGIKTPHDPPAAQLREYGKTPVIDLGTVNRIKTGEIKIVDDIRSFTANGVIYQSGEQEEFDHVILATGYTADLPEFIEITSDHFDKKGVPKSAWSEECTGLYFVGFNTSFSGILNAIYEESEQVVDKILKEIDLTKAD